MTLDRETRQFRLLSVHYVLWSLATSLAGGFVSAYLLQLGFGMAATIAMYALLLGFRFGLRAVLLPVVRRLGMHRALLLGAVIAAFQFLPLIKANEPAYLAVWIVLVSAGECLYWPIFHAANAVCGGGGKRGRQIAVRQMASTAISVLGPIGGGLLLTGAGAAAEFGLATFLCLCSAAPLAWLRTIDLGPVPTMRQSLHTADKIGLVAFAADGWIAAGTGIAWSLILFTTLGSSYDNFGWAGSAAAVAGAAGGLLCGSAIDRGHRHRLAPMITAAMAIAVLLRVASGCSPWLAFAANAVGAAVGGLYYPLLMSVIYDRAKRSGSAYQFHLSAEAGWDTGAILGCLVTAAIAWSGVPITLSVLPSVLGVLVIHRCIRAESRFTRHVPVGVSDAVPQAA